jgi:type I restriction enzyme M protein
MDGLEAVEIKYSRVKTESYCARFDSDYFKKEFLKNVLSHLNCNKLNTIAQIKSGSTPSVRDENLKSGAILLKTNDIRNNILTSNNFQDFFYIDLETNKRMAATQLNANDVLINIVGATTDVIGRVALVPEHFPSSNITQAMALCRVTNQKILPEALFVFLNSKYGNKQVRRMARPTGQFNLNLIEVGSFEIPTFSTKFQNVLGGLVIKSKDISSDAEKNYNNASTTLLEFANFKDYTPTLKNTETKTFKNSLVRSDRLDAEFYQTKFDELYNKLSQTGRSKQLGSLLQFNQRGKQPVYCENKGLPVLNSRHIRINKIELDEDNRLADPNQTTKDLIIKKGDILLNGTGVGTLGRCAAYLLDTPALPDNHVTILRTDSIDPIFLSVQLNSIIGQLQTEKYQKGSSGQIELYPSDINQFIIWDAPKEIQSQIKNYIEQAEKLEKQSKHLLSLAKQAVEIAIEQSEEAALKFIDEQKPL